MAMPDTANTAMAAPSALHTPLFLITCPTLPETCRHDRVRAGAQTLWPRRLPVRRTSPGRYAGTLVADRFCDGISHDVRPPWTRGETHHTAACRLHAGPFDLFLSPARAQTVEVHSCISAEDAPPGRESQPAPAPVVAVPSQDTVSHPSSGHRGTPDRDTAPLHAGPHQRRTEGQTGSGAPLSRPPAPRSSVWPPGGRCGCRARPYARAPLPPRPPRERPPSDRHPRRRIIGSADHRIVDSVIRWIVFRRSPRSP